MGMQSYFGLLAHWTLSLAATQTKADHGAPASPRLRLPPNAGAVATGQRSQQESAETASERSRGPARTRRGARLRHAHAHACQMVSAATQVQW